ncbi:MAG: dienelactone hydrolase family protein [Pseudomonadota bacterium]|nr:dienelactone hydrolase family protein [Pseudomonadota bacterium]
MRLKLPDLALLLACFLAIIFGFIRSGFAEPIYHEIHHPEGKGPFPAVIALHTSGGFKTVKPLIKKYVGSGFTVYAPDFFTRHGLTPHTRMDSFDRYREDIEKELVEIVELMGTNPKVDKNNLFAVGFSNGGFWVCFLTGRGKVNAGVSHYGVWKANMGRDIEIDPSDYFSKTSSPLLALHGDSDGTQGLRFAETVWDWIKESGAPIETHIYEGADHAWDQKNSRRWAYNADVDKDSHNKTIAFFRKYMK